MEEIKNYIKEHIFDHSEYQEYLKKYNITIDKLITIFEHFFEKKDHIGVLQTQFYIELNNICTYVKPIDWDNENSESYKEFDIYDKIHSELYKILRTAKRIYVEKYGMYHTIEEAASILANKMCSLLFKWHLQINGDLDNEHSFLMSAIATCLASNAREKITEKQKQNTFNIIKDYEIFCHKAYSTGVSSDELNKWKEIIKLNSIHDELSCDYEPNTVLRNLLVHAGIPKEDINNICPWKTTLCIETLNVNGMIRKKRKAINKSIHSVCLGKFINYLVYKSTLYERELRVVNKYFPSSQLCNNCGYKNSAVKDLSIRTWTCPSCGQVHDRDINAAVNILKNAIPV